VIISNPWFPYDSQLYGLLWEQFVPPRYAKKIGADVLFCPNGNGPIINVDIPVITNIQSLFAYKGMAPPSYNLLQRFRAPRSAKCANMIMTVSNYLKEEIIEYFGVSTRDVRVIYNGVDEIYQNDSPGKNIGVPDNYILFVGSMNKRKNIETLIEAYSSLRMQSDFNHELVVVGPRKKRIFEQVEIDKQIRSEINEMGFVQARELKHIYSNASVFVFPSINETFGLPPLEAMACGTPVVASNRPALPEILGDAAHFIDPLAEEQLRQGISKILLNDSYRQELIESGKSQASKYSWSNAAKQCRALFKTVIER
ncbi:MAG: glycosyltransferase family 4 protein, partial [Halobacteriaceae archaeon]